MNDMNEIVIVRPDKCVGCNACLRACPAPEANVVQYMNDGKIVITVNPAKCISCGECLRVCNHGARDYVDDTEECMSKLRNEKLVIIATPAIKTAYPTQWKGILDFFVEKNCYVYDISYGTDICLWAYSRSVSREQRCLITEPCGAVVKYAESYQPKLLKNLAPVHSPVTCEAIYIKQYLNRTNKIAVLSPCIALKEEIEETGFIDYNVTFGKLMEYFDRNGIRIPTNSADDYDYNYTDVMGLGTDLFPEADQFAYKLAEYKKDMLIMQVQGVQNVYSALDSYANASDQKRPDVYDVYSCQFGCIAGPAIGKVQSPFDALGIKRTIRKKADAKPREANLRGGIQKLFKLFDDELQIVDFMRSYRTIPQSSMPNMNQLDEAFASMDKTKDADKHIDCGACGYKTCLDMAAAIYRGLNTAESCVYSTKSLLLKRNEELSQNNKKIDELADNCRSVSERLIQNIDDVNEKFHSVGGINEKAVQKTAAVRSLLINVCAFCKKNSSMDAKATEQLVNVLNTTISALDGLDATVREADGTTGEINNAVKRLSEIANGLTEEITGKK